MKKIPFNKPHVFGKEFEYIKKAYQLCQLSGEGYFTNLAEKYIQKKIACKRSLLTHSATAALEMMALLLEINRGDEIIMPSYTFVSTANAFVLRGAIPVFVDIRNDTLNIDEKLIEKAITRRTKAIVVVHYAGIGCEMDEIQRIGTMYRLPILEDAAHGFLATYKGRHLGTIGQMGAFSFHETKNITSGEGGALLLNDLSYLDRAEIIREKGTNRKNFSIGKVDKYTWVDLGSSYLPGEITAAFLSAQLENSVRVTKKRIRIWEYYHKGLEDLEKKNKIRRPIIPPHTNHNAHIYYILTNSEKEKMLLIKFLNENNIHAVSHYVPLHSSPFGKNYCRNIGNMEVTNDISRRLIRLPLFYALTKKQQDFILEKISSFYSK